MKKKNVLVMALSLVLVAVISVGATMAYFTDQTETAVNVFTSGKVDIELVDKSPEGVDLICGEETENGIEYERVQPGDKLSKTVGVNVAAGSENAWTALKLTFSATPAQGSALTEEQAIAAVKALIAVDADKWEVADDIYYCKSALAAESGATLFKTIEIPAEWDNNYGGISFTIGVEAAAVQEANLTYEAAKAELKEMLTPEA